MPLPTQAQLSDPAFVKAMMDCIGSQSIKFETPITDLLKRPKFGKAREVHARRARKLRRRGEDVWFVRWRHGHCVYAWGGPRSGSIMFRVRRRADPSVPAYQHITYETRLNWVQEPTK
jgi:hypothetical protein